MKRTTPNLLDRGRIKTKNGQFLPFPKGIRTKSLKYVCGLNNHFICKESTPDLLKEPVKCVEFIMKEIHVSQRTAYDYYNALLYMNYLPMALNQFYKKKINEVHKMIYEKKHGKN